MGNMHDGVLRSTHVLGTHQLMCRSKAQLWHMLAPGQRPDVPDAVPRRCALVLRIAVRPAHD